MLKFVILFLLITLLLFFCALELLCIGLVPVYCEIVTIGFLAPKNIHLDTRIKSIAALDPQIIANVDFKWQPIGRT